MRIIFFIIVTAALITGCGTKKPFPTPVTDKTAYEVDGQIYHPLDSADGFRQQGVASWYGDPFHGEKTANCEVYSMYAMTAAHKTLPFGTMLAVTNKENNKTTIVRINDRGPYCRDRIIDLSYSAAQEIDMTRKGTATVEIVALGKDEDVIHQLEGKAKENQYYTGDFTVQAGSFGEKANAERVKASLESVVQNVQIAPVSKDARTLYRVRVGRFTSLRQAQQVEQQLLENGFKNVYPVTWDL
ncbi:MAG: septal ring lytic transglycosylase RlpA family protein [Desulfosalsimonadaceae bacterium]